MSDETPTEVEREVARRIVRAMFEGRKGHGGGPCSRRVLTPAEVEAVVLVAFRELRKRCAG